MINYVELLTNDYDDQIDVIFDISYIPLVSDDLQSFTFDRNVSNCLWYESQRLRNVFA